MFRKISRYVLGILRKRPIRRLFECIGLFWFSHPETDGIRAGLKRHLDFRNGVFVEAGGHNGYFQSNTYYLEVALGWNGILIEAIPLLAELCRHERSSSTVINCALVSSEYNQDSIVVEHRGARSRVEGAWANELDSEKRDKAIRDGCPIYQCTVPARTLNDIFKENNYKKIDLLSLDVEGFELPALQGINLDYYRPIFILVEANDTDEIIKYLENKDYKVIEFLTSNDILLRDASPPPVTSNGGH